MSGNRAFGKTYDSGQTESANWLYSEVLHRFAGSCISPFIVSVWIQRLRFFRRQRLSMEQVWVLSVVVCRDTSSSGLDSKRGTSSHFIACQESARVVMLIGRRHKKGGVVSGAG